MTRIKYHCIEIIVCGRGALTADALRYDNCCAASERDAHELDREDAGERSIKLKMFTPVGNTSGPNVDRFRSFGWIVIEVDGRPVFPRRM